MALAGLVQAKGVGFLFQDRRYAMTCSRSAFFVGKSVSLRDCLPKIPKKPSTWLSHEALVGV